MDGSKADGARVVQGPFLPDAGAAERWRVVKTGDGFKLMNVNSRKLLAVPAAAQAKGVRIIQWHDRNDSDLKDQRWEFVKSGDHYLLKSCCSKLFLAVGGGSKAEDHGVTQWLPTKTAEQLWYVQWVPGAAETNGQ